MLELVTQQEQVRLSCVPGLLMPLIWACLRNAVPGFQYLPDPFHLTEADSSVSSRTLYGGLCRIPSQVLQQPICIQVSLFLRLKINMNIWRDVLAVRGACYPLSLCSLALSLPISIPVTPPSPPPLTFPHPASPSTP